MKLLPLLIAAAALYGAFRWFEWRQTFHPSRAMEGDPSGVGLAFENVVFFAEDGVKLHGWWIPHPDAAGAILYCHGNAGNISTRLGVAEGLHRLGVNVFMFDYRGYGLSRGVPGEQGLYRDARAAYEVVRARYEDAEHPPVIVYGASLGGAPAVRVAAEKSVRGLVIEGGFPTSIDVAERWYPFLPASMLARYRFDSASLIMGLAMPKLIAHSHRDQVIPYDLGVQLHQIAAHPKHFITLQGDHGEAGWEDTPAYFSELQRFVQQTLSTAPGT